MRVLNAFSLFPISESYHHHHNIINSNLNINPVVAKNVYLDLIVCI